MDDNFMDKDKWHPTTNVVVVGVKDGEVTNDPNDKQRFSTLVEARTVFPDLTPDLPGHRFTEALANLDTDEMQFRVRAIDEEGVELYT